MTNERLAEIKQAAERYRGKGYPLEIEELVEALETERARLDWVFGDPSKPESASRQQIEEILMHTSTPDEARAAIDYERAKGAGR